MGRSELREHIFRILFRIEFQSKEEMEEQLALYLEELESAKDTEKEYIRTKYAAIAEKVEMIDEKINASVTGWKTSRMGKVDLTILRLAVYEIEWDEEVPQGVAINEAVELAKRYGGEESPSFINGVLGKIVNSR
ncbi:transcription antitermination factor NusB [Faecalimonas umbilicata]|uniref:transcription antitermination factor NusB n=1 Tax=Faecalimonas umbilicata TaxID=1912855 RepID=UPI0022E7E526|nr:transcription antitermination factor NusB [Faecalimonas umbilicata]